MPVFLFQVFFSSWLAYVFALVGPSMTIDTACSSSLVAMDAACKAMYAHECEVAVAVGVNLLFNFEVFIRFRAAGMLSRKGRCATFWDDADGYLREEGCGAVLLKPLSSALGVYSPQIFDGHTSVKYFGGLHPPDN